MMAVICPLPALAQVNDAGTDNRSIVVNGRAFDPLLQLERTFSEPELRSFGVDTIQALIGRLAGESASQSESPAILLNGRRAISATEFSSLPVEAIASVDVLSAQAARALGYSPGQPVYNLLLKDDFDAFTLNVEGGFATDGGRQTAQGKASFTSIAEDERITLSAASAYRALLRESERDIIESLGSEGIPVAAIDEPLLAESGRNRSLLGRGEDVSLSGSYTRPLGQVLATANAKVSKSKSTSLSGFPISIIAPPSGSPLLRILSDKGLRITAETDGIDLSVGFKGDWGAWRWSGSLVWRHDRTDTETGLGFDSSSYQQAVSSGTLPADEPIPSYLLLPLPNAFARADTELWQADFRLHGPFADLPAGPVQASVKGSLAKLLLDVRSEGPGRVAQANLGREAVHLQASLQVPLVSDKSASGPASISLEGAVLEFSDYGMLLSYSTSLDWRPTPALSFDLSYTRQEPTATLLQLGAPQIITPNLRVYDFMTGSTVDVTFLEAGNSALKRSDQRSFRAGFTWKPLRNRERVTVTTNYVRTAIDNPMSALPYMTPEGFLAFPDRFTRSPDGILTSIDARPVNLFRTRSDFLRSGVSVALPTSKDEDPNRGRLSASLFYTLRLEDTVSLAQGIKVDYLDGSALGSLGGRPRHVLEADVSYYRSGLGGRVDFEWRAGTHIGDWSERLEFSSRSRLNIRLFAELGEVLGAGASFASGLRASLAIQNIFDDKITVRDPSGLTPLRYQSQLLEPLGRTFVFGIRKQL